MRLAAGVVLGATVMVLMHILGWPLIGWLLTRVPPPTHPDSRPRFRRWVNGVPVESGE
ncbi:hypothetical protein [Microbacterium esteraromaticum]|uniref:hypothetical protein n=1 Tax=Microbacterium esteraromaticum TaxID=57043 RepID=UPI0019D335E6|nr:hypothetical protein [Microbacterium esteraromaticum]MBN7792417.1 hypothetical protein [Microbacterium esteraromaticum]